MDGSLIRLDFQSLGGVELAQFDLLCAVRAGWWRDHVEVSFAGGERGREGRGRRERSSRPPVELLQFNLRSLRPRGGSGEEVFGAVGG